ncbi:LOW QUALITY PROTEIN: piwi-like protein Siwi [Acyrthosiphon pisum]|uniref:Piwi-like protein Siwi n=1 Tax=Acyrthosiphon pisum TaxID=7029 RepID=A0A8R2JKZ7_ACYPI|nr:LOW QUALITY PROTEIN: piwi-like protein Siwi [Acyrthosiphon pisum]
MNYNTSGTSGQPVKLLANYFPITSYTNWCLYQYRTDLSPEEDRIATKRELLGQHQKHLGGYLFDGTMLFSGTRFDTPTFELISTRCSDDKIVTITVKFTNITETGDYANIQVFNLLLRKCLRHLKLKMIGRHFYDPDAKIDMIQHKLQLWPGYETTIGRYEDNILLCAEISTKVMRQETVLDFLNQCAANRNRNKDWMIDVIGTTVITKYNNETYKIDDIDENSDPNSEFSKKDGSKMTYIQYKWNITIRGGRQPMLISKNKKSVRRFGAEDTLVYLVPELCIMTGLTDAMRNNFTLMKDMAIHTRVNPKERVERLTNFANRFLSTPDIINYLYSYWNLTLSNKLVELTGRILQPEPIQSRSKGNNGGEEADWTKHLRSLPMFTSATVKNWYILAPRDSCLSNTFLNDLEKVINESNPSLILCVIPSVRGDMYSMIKRKLCIDRAVPSQVVLLKNVQKNNMSLCTKIAIQINCKLGGAPWLVTIPKKGMMIVGFDVCHDSQRKNLSFGALVSTMNDAHTSYFSCVEPHESGEELSVHFATGISSMYDFFLVSQHVRQGTVTPTHYQVIEDTLGLPPNIMQRLTFKLTHMYYNWSGTVRVPAPCQLVHKLAFLTGQNLRRSPNIGLDWMSCYTSFNIAFIFFIFF